jgi:peptidoglycan-N-acetylglucosamine deacetylase
LLEVLARHDVRATFFMVGRYAAQLPEIARAVAAAGHVIGNHTYTHPNLIFCSPGQVQAQLHECDRVLTSVVGEHSKLFRPPFGGRRPDVLRMTRQHGFVPVMWSVSSHDWNPGPAEQIENKIARQVRGGDVILMHDGGHLSPTVDRSATIAATDNLITRYKGEGFSFVTVPEMIATEPAK